MGKKIIAAFLLIVLIGFAFYQSMQKADEKANNPESGTGVEVGDLALDFTLKDLDGTPVKLSDYQGKKVMLNFWATWCGPCKVEMPEIEKLQNKYPDLVVLAVNMDPENDPKSFMDKNGYTFMGLIDEEGLISTNYKIIAIPTSFFINEEGTIKEKTQGSLTYDMLEESIINL